MNEKTGSFFALREASPKGCATYDGKKLLVLFLNLVVFHSINL